MSEAPEFTPRQAMQRWLNKQRADKSESTVSTYYYRLKLFVEWCEREGIEYLSQLSGWDLEEYEVHRLSKDLAETTHQNEMKTLKVFLRRMGAVGVVDQDLYESVNIPNVSREAASDDTRLTTEDAVALIRHYRTSSDYGSRAHVLLELAWTIGARVGGLRALDLRDVDLDAKFVRFVHRPETGTPLKRNLDGERVAGIHDEVADAVQAYIDGPRIVIEDSHGRRPLLTGQQGRPTPGTIKDWMYLATTPCTHCACPHGRDPGTCDWLTYTTATHCPSTRSPHQVRTGSITWHRNQDWEDSNIADRVNATVRTIKKHYDKEEKVREMEARRRHELQKTSIQDNHDTEE